MQFLTFVKRNFSITTDEEIISFCGWIFTKEYSTKNPNASAEQLLVYMREKGSTREVKNGFVKSCIAYHQQPQNVLPIELKEDLAKTIEFANGVFG